MAAEPGSPPEDSEDTPGTSIRVLFAAGLAILLAILVGAVLVLAGGSEDPEVADAAPAECLEEWNRDKSALAFSRHNATFHEYESAQVGYLEATPSAEVSADSADGDCVVVFPRNSLDPEPIAAGQILDGGLWTPLDSILPLDEVARLQSEAFAGANAEPTPSGRIIPLAESS